MGEEEEGEDSQDSMDGGFQIDDGGFNMDNLMGQDLDDLDQDNADLKQQEQMIDGLFVDDEGSPDGIDQAEISDIQKIINKSMEESPELLQGMDFAANEFDAPEGGAVGAAFENGEEMEAYDEDYYDQLPDGHDFGDMDGGDMSGLN